MTPERWQQIDKLLEEALARPAGERSAFLDQACAGDEGLRCKVEALLAAHGKAESFIETSALAAAAQALAEQARSMVGRQLGHYQILALLGAGGMGEVYRARDTKLGRLVALKFLPATVGADRDRMQRFVREARAASAINHPNVATIYEIGETDGINFIAMEYVEGQTLQARLSSQPLETTEIVEIATQIADALAEAHAKGITHRDIKPANLMLNERGQVKVLDFGLAKVTRAAEQSEGGASALAKTAPGIVMGTVRYMSPEQVLGRELDHRTDIFSLGVVLYEMATGVLPFRGVTSTALLDEVLHKVPVALVRLNPELPAGLEEIINKLLEKDRQLRYQSAAELRVDLQRLKRDRESGSKRSAVSSASAAAVRSLAVLPFANLSADKENEYFSDGLAEEVINALTRLPGMRVIARTSSFSFRGKEVDAREIGARLNVENILEGSVRKAGNRIRVMAQLVHAGDGYQLWSERYDREMTDVFAVQDEICQAIVGKLKLQLAAGCPLVKCNTENVEAYNLWLKARHQMWKFTPAGLAKSKEYCEQALALDPKYALAWVGLAVVYLNMSVFGILSPDEAKACLQQAAQKALELDDKLAEAHAIMAVIQAGDYNWKGAELEFRRALELNPKSEDVLVPYGQFYLVPMQRLDEAVAESRRTLEMNPLAPYMQWRLGYHYFLKQDWNRVIEQCHNALELDPNYVAAHDFLGLTYIQLGRFDEAISTFEKVMQLRRGGPIAIGYLGFAYARAGRTGEARKLLGQLQDLSQKIYVPPSCFVILYLGLGEINKAVEWLEKAVDGHDGLVLHLHVNPLLDLVRKHPRYPALLRKMNLEKSIG